MSRDTWVYQDMLGMLVWYRLIFKARFELNDPDVQADGMWVHLLLSSPWWDCPELQGALDAETRLGNGKFIRNMDGMSANMKAEEREKERKFLTFWGLTISRLPLRRFPDSTMVMNNNYSNFVDKYGAWAARWPHQQYPWFFGM
ncbi:hypothetical protein BGZ63DRAFT_387049 [Mariannaea sp. PMI_226]|nr:hypothetical protein BGZ63DRAFT_387049 [Mariannaea sp. PMI_226]